MYDTGEYNVKLQIPTDNYIVADLLPHDLKPISDYLQKIKVYNKETLIVLFGGFQCLAENARWIQAINEYAKNIPNPVIVFNGLLASDVNYKIKDLDFSYNRISMFEHVSNIYWHESKCNKDWIQDIHKERNKKFYWASTKDWYTRRYVLAGLINQHLLDDGLVNYKCLYTDIPSDWLSFNIDSSLIHHIQQECESISKNVPLPPLDDTVEFYDTDVNFYLDSFLGIITDTFYVQGVFFSEKVFHAMNHLQLFFYIGYQGSLKYLKNKGYEVFDDIIDTGYDNIQEPGARLIAARASLIEFLNCPIEKIRSDYEKSRPAIQHNKELLQKQRPDLEFTTILQKILNEH
jgi:hypothetical protein